MESMKRIDVLKGIEKILVEKAYETGHISHRANGDWQKQADGSWTPYTGQSDQSTSQAQEPAPTENTEYGEITEEEIIEAGDSYWSSTLEGENSEEEDDPPDGEDDWDRYDDITDMIQNTDWESIVAEYDNPSVDQIMSDYDFPDDERIRDEISIHIHTDDSDEDYEQNDEDLDITDADSVTDLEEQTPDLIFRNSDNIDKFLESNNINLDYGANQKFTGYVSELANAYRDGEDINKVLEEFKQRNEIYNNEEAQEGYDTFIKYFNSSPLSSSIQKSAVRDMRSIPAIKNMGF